MPITEPISHKRPNFPPNIRLFLRAINIITDRPANAKLRQITSLIKRQALQHSILKIIQRIILIHPNNNLKQNNPLRTILIKLFL